MNILLTDSTDIFAGGEDYVLTLARFLGKRGHTVTVSAIPGHLLLTRCREQGIATAPIAYGGMHRVLTVSSLLRRQLLDRGIEIVHSNANYDRTCAGIATAFTRVRHIAGIHSTHSIQHNLTHWLRNRYGTDHFITDAEAGREVLLHEDRISPERITTVPIGIDDPDPSLMLTMRERTRRELEAGAETVIIGNVARLVPFKGHRVLLEAIALAVRTRSNLLFLLVGDGELLADLEERVGRLNIGPFVRFLGFRPDLDALYPAFDLYCHSSLDMASEMFPIAILRALASGVAVVASNVGGIAHMVEEGVSGRLVPPDDPAALAEAILALAADLESRKSMGRASRLLYEKRYHAALMAERVEQVYRSVLTPLRPGHQTR